MKGVRHYLVCVPALLFLVLAACQFKEPSLEIIAQEAYGSQSDILVQTRFEAENDQHTCEYSLVRESDSVVVASGSPVLPAGTLNDLLFDVTNDGRYLFDFHVLDAGGAPISCLCNEAEFWVDTTNPVIPTLNYSEETVPDVTWTVYLNDHPDNSNSELSPVTIFYNLDYSPLGDGPEPDANSTKYNPLTGIVLDISVLPRLKTIAIDVANNKSLVKVYLWSEYQP
jgi:hypothetical protein